MAVKKDMVTARGGAPRDKWYSLYDKVIAPLNLRLSFDMVKANRGAAGIDGESIEAYEERLDERLRSLAEKLRTKTYAPQPVRRVFIPKPDGSQRPLGIPTVEDRLVQQAMRRVIEPIYEAEFLPCSFGFRPNKSAHHALNWVIRSLEQGYTYIVDADIRAFFDSIDHERLLNRINEKISDGTVLAMIRAMLTAGAMVDGALEETEQGTPQGGVISPLLANISLHPLDEAMWPEITRYRYVRYADDFVICCRSRADAETALERVRRVIEGLGLTLHPAKTRIVTHEEGFDFLGYHFQREPWQGPDRDSTVRPRDKAIVKFKDTVRGLTRRQQGQSVYVIVGRLNRYLRSWRSYFEYTTWKQQTFRQLDQWIRHRIRSYLAKRWNPIINRLYPLRHLAALGLYTLESGQPLAGLPRQRRNPSSKAGYQKSVRPV